LFSRPRDLPVNMISGNDSIEKDLKILLDIVHVAPLIIRFTENMTFEEFLDDERTQSAALYQILGDRRSGETSFERVSCSTSSYSYGS